MKTFQDELYLYVEDWKHTVPMERCAFCFDADCRLKKRQFFAYPPAGALRP